MNRTKLHVISEPYTYIPAGSKGIVPLKNDKTGELFEAEVEAIEVKNMFHQCAIYGCDLQSLEYCYGCRCMAGGRKDGKTVIFKILSITKKE